MPTTWLGVNAARLVTRILVCWGLTLRPFLLNTTVTSDMTQTQAGARRPKRCTPFPPRRSGHPGALVVFLRHMGHQIFERFILYGLPSTGDRKDKGPAACC